LSDSVVVESQINLQLTDTISLKFAFTIRRLVNVRQLGHDYLKKKEKFNLISNTNSGAS